MNISIMSAKEIIRIFRPETENEQKLFDLLVDQQDEISDLEDRPVNDCDCEENQSEIDDLCAGISQAIDLIEQGKVDEAKKLLQVGI